MGEPNWKNRTLFHGDNLEFMRAMNSDSVDLIATDPPFNKGKDFHATPDSLASGAKFQDRWNWQEDVHPDWVQLIEGKHPNVWQVIASTKESWGDDMAAFLCYMAVRLIAMRRLLKPTGSIYLHCDPTASHYLKMLMDAIFGRKNFQNEIIWSYRTGGSSKTRFSKKHDVILFYGSSNRIFNVIKEKSYTKAQSRKPGVINYGGGTAEFFEDEHGVFNLVNCRDVWEMSYIGSTDPERTGYPTQKPLALYERIVQASSGGGSVVLDPFCGCATTCVAAEKHKRQWVGIDIWPKVQDVVVERLEKEGLIAPKYTRKTPSAREQYFWAEELHFTDKLPQRTDDGKTDVDYLETIESFAKEPWERLSRTAMTKHLGRAQTKGDWVICAGCGRELEIEFMELDHIKPKAGRGADDITNRILLCGPCNKRKRHRLTLVGLMDENEKENWMYDLTAAKNSQVRAENYAQKIRRGQISLKDGIE